jgi:hypothetical protein
MGVSRRGCHEPHLYSASTIREVREVTARSVASSTAENAPQCLLVCAAESRPIGRSGHPTE